MDARNALGLCRSCDRWFAVSEVGDAPEGMSFCPACRSRPARIVRGEEPAEEGPKLRIEGQCPRCRGWFPADDWYDDAAPVPCCPDCHLVPAKLAYVHDSGKRVERVLTVDVEHSELWLG